MINSELNKHPVMRYHGSKFRLAKWVIQFFPPHVCYCEPFGGAAGVLIQKQRVQAEIYNDLDGDIVNVFRVLQNNSDRDRLFELLMLTPYSRKEFEIAYQETDDIVIRAQRTLIRAYMGFGSASATKGASGFRINIRKKYGLDSHLWARYPSLIAGFGERLAGVIIENKKAIDVIEYCDDDETLFYVDPPYVKSTRVKSGGKYYRHEMTDEEHLELINILKNVTGFVVLSAYRSDLYADELHGWEQRSTNSRISAQIGTDIREEIIWLNPKCSEAQGQICMNFED